MKLYSFDIAPNPRRVNHLLQYKGVDLDSEQVSLLEGQQLSSAFRAVNPRCTVPTLVLDDGTVLSDTIAICLYLDSQFPEPPLFGSNDLERAQIVGACHQIFMEGTTAVAEVLRNQGDHFKGRALPGTLDLPQIPELVERGVQRIQHFFQTIDKQLQGKPYVVGEQLSQADIDLMVWVDFCGWVKQSPPDGCTALHEWLGRVRPLFA